MKPKGQRDLVDTFPLTGELARMDWQPGDAPMLRLESVDVIDDSPRQITSVAWPFRPDGLGAPTVGFRQRPRSPRNALKRLSAIIYAPRRNFQGQLALVGGSVGGVDHTGGALAGCSDAYSRLALPSTTSTIASAELVVLDLEGSDWRMEVGNIDLGENGAVTEIGRYDISAAVAGPKQGYLWARLIGGTSGYYIAVLEVWVMRRPSNAG